MHILKLNIIGAITAVILTTGSCKEKPLAAVVTMMRGNVTYTQENSTAVNPVTPGGVLHQGDVIRTGDNSGVVLNVRETGSNVEIQSNSVFHLTSLKNDKIELFSEKGNVWVNTEKKPGSPEAQKNYFKVVTPTMVAAVRGTTFYVFNIEDMEGVCHCKGDVEFSRSSSAYKAEHHTDNLVISKGEKSVLITPEELKKIGLKHNHSIFENSPVGPQNQMTEKEYKTLVAFFRKKLAEVK